jgi:hypothetical protein
MSFAGSLLEQGRAYRSWQTSFARRNRTPVLVRNPSGWAKFVLSEKPFVVRLPSRWDHSKLPRCAEKWKRLFDVVFEPIVPRPHQLAGMCVAFWTMVYFKGSWA